MDVGWSEADKLGALKRGLAYSLKNDLVRVPTEPTTILEFAALCNKLDTRRRALQGVPRPISSQPQPAQATTTAAAAAPHAQATQPTATGDSHRPLGLSANRRRFSPEERARLLVEGRCFRCRGLGHMTGDCPLRPRPMGAAAATTTPELPTPINQTANAS